MHVVGVFQITNTAFRSIPVQLGDGIAIGLQRLFLKCKRISILYAPY